ncbi:MAG: glycosyltransferase family 4 protein, partial [Promicromonosporaceae bacterium]|nr:glycosyltransferase family 4 protein [Promicromonosporaceae bacterium]
DQRLTAVAGALLPAATPPADGAPGEAAATLLPELVEAAVAALADGDTAPLWLLLTGVSVAFPNADTMQRMRRAAKTMPRPAFEMALLETTFYEARHEATCNPEHPGRFTWPLRITTDVVVEVDFTGRHDHQTGIQRTVRETVSRWADHAPLELALWDETGSILRAATARERARILRRTVEVDVSDVADGGAHELLVPWQTRVLLPDVPQVEAASALAGLAQFSGNRVSAIGYDLIPVVSAETRPFTDAVAAGKWLAPIKHTERIAAISGSAANEFSGYAEALEAQGLAGPLVRAIPIPDDTRPEWFQLGPRTPRERVRLVFSGTKEPHKNHRALVHAAARLWEEGQDFEVRLIGGFGCTDQVSPAINALAASGRPIHNYGRVSEEQLWQELADADAVVFASLHEGYGLPVVEALSVGTPVLTSNFGSQAEIAADGGCLTVDPRDDEALVAAMRQLITDAGLRERLRAEIPGRPHVTWADYARQTWEFLTDEEGQP